MLTMSRRPWLHLLLVPAFLLANLLCVCAHAATPVTLPHAAKVRSCCESKQPSADQSQASTPSHTPADMPAHMPAQCPHCAEKGKMLADSSGTSIDLTITATL